MPHRAALLGTTCTLRSTHWSGPPPEPGDYLVTAAGTWYLVDTVAEGAGLGHYRMGCVRIGQPDTVDGSSVYRWRWAPRRTLPG